MQQQLRYSLLGKRIKSELVLALNRHVCSKIQVQRICPERTKFTWKYEYGTQKHFPIQNTWKLYKLFDRLSAPFSLMNGNVWEISLSKIVQARTMPTQTVLVCRIKTLKSPVKQICWLDQFAKKKMRNISFTAYRKQRKVYVVVSGWAKTCPKPL